MNDSDRGKETDANNAARGGPLIAVVDDDDLTRRSTRRLLRSVGLRAEDFASAEEFLRCGVVWWTDCLLLDLRMPGMTGLQLQQELAAKSKPVPIIFISAHFTAEDERRALRAGAIRFLEKPVSKEVLLLAIREALNPPNK